MKKRKFAILLTTVSVLFLCSCASTSTLTFSANWYKNTSITNPSATSEELEYEVLFKASDNASGFSVQYRDGLYTTKLKNEILTLSDGTTKEGYSYSTELTISGQFSLNGETGETFHDYVRSTVKFLPVGDRLQPVKSEKEVHSNTPVSVLPSSLKGAVTVYHYSYAVDYAADLKSAAIRYTNLAAPTENKKEIKIDDGHTYLDNEQIAFALRGLNLNTAVSFATINPVTNTVQTLNVQTTALTHSASFTVNGEAVSDTQIEAHSATLAYNTTYSGQPQTLVYADMKNANNNKYRNVLLKMSVPIVQSMGTMEYNLKKADFSDKS